MKPALLCFLSAAALCAQTGFSHAKHLDAKARIDPRTGFRADCTWCHKFDARGIYATMPGPEQCATCHPKSAAMTVTPAAVRYPDIEFSHRSHLKTDCTTCHYNLPALPKMVDCVQCHDSPRIVKAAYRMSNCTTCHMDTSHTLNVKPDFHTEAFRRDHAAEAAAADAKCFVCHQNVRPSRDAKLQCTGCHAVMKPVSHTSRWKDDLHGKYAAMDKTTCATCHTAAYCSDCHNELPRSHQPMALFKAGAHAFPAKLSLRTCFTCHTFQNTCSECHLNKIQ